MAAAFPPTPVELLLALGGISNMKGSTRRRSTRVRQLEDGASRSDKEKFTTVVPTNHSRKRKAVPGAGVDSSDGADKDDLKSPCNFPSPLPTVIDRTNLLSKGWHCGGACEEMIDSTALWQTRQSETLRKRLRLEGYLLLRGVIPREDVLQAEQVIRQKLEQCNSLKQSKHGWLVDMRDGVVQPATLRDDPDQWSDVRDHHSVRTLPYHARLDEALSRVFASTGHTSLGPEHRTTWIRAKRQGEATVPHSDYGYFVRNRHIFKQFYKPHPLTYKQSYQLAALNSTAGGLSTEEKAKRCAVVDCCRQQQQAPAAHVAMATAITKIASQRLLVCSLCGLGYHEVCVGLHASKASTNTSSTHSSNASDSEGEWHCPTCRDAYFSFFTCWMPLCDVPADPSFSRLMVVPGSHTLGGYSCASGRAAIDDELLPSDWTAGGKQDCMRSTSVWHAPSQLRAGDIILFNIKTIHAANEHKHSQYRISIDTRVVGHDIPPRL